MAPKKSRPGFVRKMVEADLHQKTQEPTKIFCNLQEIKVVLFRSILDHRSSIGESLVAEKVLDLDFFILFGLSILPAFAVFTQQLID